MKMPARRGYDWDMEPLLIPPAELARRLNVSERTLRAHAAAGLVPRPARLGGLVRYSLAEIEAWVAAGCPPRDKWKWPKR